MPVLTPSKNVAPGADIADSANIAPGADIADSVNVAPGADIADSVNVAPGADIADSVNVAPETPATPTPATPAPAPSEAAADAVKARALADIERRFPNLSPSKQRQLINQQLEQRGLSGRATPFAQAPGTEAKPQAGVGSLATTKPDIPERLPAVKKASEKLKRALSAKKVIDEVDKRFASQPEAFRRQMADQRLAFLGLERPIPKGEEAMRALFGRGLHKANIVVAALGEFLLNSMDVNILAPEIRKRRAAQRLKKGKGQNLATEIIAAPERFFRNLRGELQDRIESDPKLQASGLSQAVGTPRWWIANGLEAVPLLASQIAAAFLTKGAGGSIGAASTAFALPAATQSFGLTYAQSRREMEQTTNLDPDTRHDLAAIEGGIAAFFTAITSKIEFSVISRAPGAKGAIMGPVRHMLRNAVRFLAGRGVVATAESVQETLEQAAQEASRQFRRYLADQPIDFEMQRFMQDEFEAGLLGFGLGLFLPGGGKSRVTKRRTGADRGGANRTADHVNSRDKVNFTEAEFQQVRKRFGAMRRALTSEGGAPYDRIATDIDDRSQLEGLLEFGQAIIEKADAVTPEQAAAGETFARLKADAEAIVAAAKAGLDRTKPPDAPDADVDEQSGDAALIEAAPAPPPAPDVAAATATPLSQQEKDEVEAGLQGAIEQEVEFLPKAQREQAAKDAQGPQVLEPEVQAEELEDLQPQTGIEPPDVAPVEPEAVDERKKTTQEIREEQLAAMPPVEEGKVRLFHGVTRVNPGPDTVAKVEKILKEGLITGEDAGTIESAPIVFSTTEPGGFGTVAIAFDVPVADAEIAGGEARIGRRIRPDEIAGLVSVKVAGEGVVDEINRRQKQTGIEPPAPVPARTGQDFITESEVKELMPKGEVQPRKVPGLVPAVKIEGEGGGVFVATPDEATHIQTLERVSEETGISIEELSGRTEFGWVQTDDSATFREQQIALDAQEKPATPAEKPPRTSGREPDVVPAERQLPKHKLKMLRTLVEHVTGQKKTEGRTFGAKTRYETAQRAAKEAERVEKRRGRAEMKAAVDKLRETLAAVRAKRDDAISDLKARAAEKRADGKLIRDQQKELRKLVQEHLPIAEQGALLTAIENARTPLQSDRAMTRLSDAIEAYEHKLALADYRKLLKAVDPNRLRPEFRDKVKPIFDTFDDKELSAASEARLQGIQDYIDREGQEGGPDADDIRDIPFDIRESLNRLRKVGLAKMPAEKIEELNDAIRYWAYRNSDKQQKFERHRKAVFAENAKSAAAEVNAQPQQAKVSERTGETLPESKSFVRLPFSGVSTILNPERMAERVSGGVDTVFFREIFNKNIEAYDTTQHNTRDDNKIISDGLEAAGVTRDDLIEMSGLMAGRVSRARAAASAVGQVLRLAAPLDPNYIRPPGSGPRQRRGETRANIIRVPGVTSTNGKHKLTLTEMQGVKLLGYFKDPKLRAEIQRGRRVTVDGFPADARFRFTTEQIRAFEAAATPRMLAVGKVLTDYYNGPGRARYIAYSVERWGHDNSVEGIYEPALVERLNQEKELQVSLAKASVDNMGITKSRVKNATAPLRVTDAMGGVWNHIVQVNTLQHMARTVGNARSLLLTESVQDALRTKFGPDYVKYWNNYFDEFARTVGSQFFGSTSADGMVNDIIDRVTIGYLGWNPSAGLKQIASLAIASNEIPWKNIQQAVREGSMWGKKGKAIDERMSTYSGYLWARQNMGAIGLVNESSGRSRLPIQGRTPFSERFMSLIHGIDRQAIRAIWRAVEITKEADFKAGGVSSNDAVKSEAYWAAVAALANKTVRTTQPTSDPLTIAPASLSARHNKFQKSMLMFMTQRFKNVNIYYNSIDRMKHARRVIQDPKSTAEQIAEARKLSEKARRDLARTVVLNSIQITLIGMMWASTLKAIKSLIPGGDDERRIDERTWWQKALLGIVENTIGNFPYIAPALDVMLGISGRLVGSKKRVFKSELSPVGGAVMDVAGATEGMFDATVDIFSEEEDSEWWRLALAGDKLAQAAIPVFGLPVSVYRVAMEASGVRGHMREQLHKTPAVAARLVNERTKLRKKEKDEGLSQTQKQRLTALDKWREDDYLPRLKKINAAMDEGRDDDFKSERRQMRREASELK